MTVKRETGTMEHEQYIDEEIPSTLTRYIDGYGWSFNMARRLINRTFGTEYTDKQLKKLYKKNKEDMP